MRLAVVSSDIPGKKGKCEGEMAEWLSSAALSAFCAQPTPPTCWSTGASAKSRGADASEPPSSVSSTGKGNFLWCHFSCAPFPSPGIITSPPENSEKERTCLVGLFLMVWFLSVTAYAVKDLASSDSSGYFSVSISLSSGKMMRSPVELGGT